MKKEEKNKINKEVLDSLYKGCNMGMAAIRKIIEQVTDKKFKKVIEKEFKKYKEIQKCIEEKYEECGLLTPDKTTSINKVMNSLMTDMALMKDNSDTKIAELLLKGSNMGIIEGKKLINHKEKMDRSIEKILREFIEMQEDSVEIYKKYL